VREGNVISLSAGDHSALIRSIIELATVQFDKGEG